MSRRKILVADLLCGAGGSSTGCERALRELGLDMDLVCVNHWQTAIDTHTLNHPKARHFVQDIATVRPHLLVPEGYLDLLMASPTCTHHSVARGGKPTSDQQRSDPWHIITWLTELRVKRLIIENVWEFTGWGPVDPKTGKPIKERKGEYFAAWIDTLRRLGFEPEWRKLNAADYGDATTRSRFILMARSDGRRVFHPRPTHAKRPDEGLALFPTLQPWKPAREIIDWSIRGRSIFDRKKPLAPKTLARIYAGAVKFGWPQPFLVVLRNHMTAQGLDSPLPVIAAEGQHIGLAEPVMFGNRTNNVPKSVDAPIGGITGTAGGGGQALLEPVIVRSGMHGANGPGFSSADLPLPTNTTDGGLAVVEPFMLSQHSDGAPRSTDDPLFALTTGGAAAENHPGCARPMLVESFVVNGRRGNEPKSVETDPIPALDTKGGVWVAEPFVASVAHGNSPDDATADSRRSRSVDDPLGVVAAGGGDFAIVEPFVLSQASGGAPRGTALPIPTAPTGGAHALISAYYSTGGGANCRSAEDPLPPATTRDRFGLIIPVTHHDTSNRARDVDVDPIPTPTGANRGELAFITAQHGERPGQAPRVHSVSAPAPTIAATGHVDLVEPAQGLEGYDILFRMLEPHELAAAMGFTDEDQAYEFAGNKTEQVKQIGNAVAVTMMKACVGAIMADAAPKRRAPAAAARVEAA